MRVRVVLILASLAIGATLVVEALDERSEEQVRECIGDVFLCVWVQCSLISR